MTFETPNYFAVMPEIFVLSMACIILIFDLYVRDHNRILTYLLAQLTLVVAAVLTIYVHSDVRVLAFNGTFVADSMADVLKVFVYLITAVVFMYSREYLRLRGLFRGEFYVLGLFGVLGMMIIISAHSFLTVYLGLELMSLSMYAMVAMNRDSVDASEAAMKYFVLGALASGMLLYGMSMIYGVTGSLDIAMVSSAISQKPEFDLVTTFGLVFLVVGLAFKLGAVPFHMWIPDVYHGAPTAVTLYIGAAPKIAAFAMVMRVLAEGLGTMQADWQDMLVILAILSMALGNIIAIAQTNIKRMLAYSTISHVGFLLLGILAATNNGYSSAMFYTIVYALMSMGGFGMIIMLSRAGFEADSLDDFKGLNQRSPWYAFVMLILMFSMAGVPPTLGFYAKLSVLQSLVDVNVGMVWLAVVAVVFSIIGAFYYLRIIKLMYFDAPLTQEPLQCSFDMRMVMSANGIGILALGLYPAALMNMCVGSFT